MGFVRTPARRVVVRLAGTLLLAWLAATRGGAAGGTIVVSAGGDLQAAINAARPGDTILLQAGATFIGNFTLPVKSGASEIVIRSAGDPALLPAAGVRVTPADAPRLAKLRSGNTMAVLEVAPGAHHWRLELLEFQANVSGYSDIIKLGDGLATSLAGVPYELVIDRCYIHGDPVSGQKRGISLQSASTSILNSYIADIKAEGMDTQAIGGWNGPGPYLIENNYLEAAGENIMFGGADPSITNLVPSDITIRRNYLTKPAAWRGSLWTVKNLFELKSGRRVLVEGNVFEHNWPAAQNGYAILLKSVNQDGTAPWSVVEDVTFQYNIVRHVAAAINVLGYAPGYPCQQLRNLQIRHNLFYDVGANWGGDGRFLLIGGEPANVVLDHNTIVHDGDVVYAYGATDGSFAPIQGFQYTNNLSRHNTYGVKGDSHATGLDTLTAYFPGLVFNRNVLAGGSASDYPTGTLFPSAADFLSQFVSAETGDYRLVAGSPFRGAATDGRDIGVDFLLLNGALAGSAPILPPPTAPRSLRVIR